MIQKPTLKIHCQRCDKLKPALVMFCEKCILETKKQAQQELADSINDFLIKAEKLKASPHWAIQQAFKKFGLD